MSDWLFLIYGAIGACGASIVLWLTIGKRVVSEYGSKKWIELFTEDSDDARQTRFALFDSLLEWAGSSRLPTGNKDENGSPITISPAAYMFSESARFLEMRLLNAAGTDKKRMNAAQTAIAEDMLSSASPIFPLLETAFPGTMKKLGKNPQLAGAVLQTIAPMFDKMMQGNKSPFSGSNNNSGGL